MKKIFDCYNALGFFECFYRIDFEEWASIATVVAAILIAISAVLAFRQLRISVAQRNIERTIKINSEFLKGDAIAAADQFYKSKSREEFSKNPELALSIVDMILQFDDICALYDRNMLDKKLINDTTGEQLLEFHFHLKNKYKYLFNWSTFESSEAVNRTIDKLKLHYVSDFKKKKKTLPDYLDIP